MPKLKVKVSIKPILKPKQNFQNTKAHSIASFYGFNPIPSPFVSKDDISIAKRIRKGNDDSEHETKFPVEEKVAMIRSIIRDSGEPINFPHQTFSEQLTREDGTQKKQVRALHVLGSSESLTDALIIKATTALLETRGFDSLIVKINSIGNRDSLARFTREMNNFSRNIVNDLDKDGRQILKKGIFSLLAIPKYSYLKEQLPESIGFLNEEGRRHFAQVLEHLQSANIPFEIDKSLFGSNHYSSHTIFEVVDSKNNNVLAIGSRHDSLARKIGFKKEIPGIGSVILGTHVFEQEKRPSKPACFFTSFGPLARMKSLTVLDMLRQNNIPIIQAIACNKISVQLSMAEKSDCPYIIIMGHQEALDNAVIIRKKDNRSQTIVSINELVPRIKVYLKEKR